MRVHWVMLSRPVCLGKGTRVYVVIATMSASGRTRLMSARNIPIKVTVAQWQAHTAINPPSEATCKQVLVMFRPCFLAM